MPRFASLVCAWKRIAYSHTPLFSSRESTVIVSTNKAAAAGRPTGEDGEEGVDNKKEEPPVLS
jgi:hypothetical protein